MSVPLTDEGLRQLKRWSAQRIANDPRVLALLADLVNGYPQTKIHWLTDSRDHLLGDWLARRLLRQGRLSAMIDKASSVRSLCALAAADFQQYAVEQRRRELPTRLFKRLDALLRDDPERFKIMLAAGKPGPTYWTLVDRPASTIFSERDHELRGHVFAVGLNTLDEGPDADTQTQFVSAAELRRYAFEMLERTARGLTLDQLVLGLVQAYGLRIEHDELPDEDLLGDAPNASERSRIPTHDPPALPETSHIEAARLFVAALTARQINVLRGLLEEQSQREIARTLSCSPATISNEKDAIAAALTACAASDDQVPVLNATANLLYGTSK